MKYKKYEISLNDDGKIVCNELGIVGDTVDEVKKAIRATEVVQEAKPKIKILYNIGQGWSEDHYAEGTTTGRVTSNKYERVWITYTDKHGKQKREKVNGEYLIVDTPENRLLVSQIEALSKQNSEMESQISKLKYQLKRL